MNGSQVVQLAHTPSSPIAESDGRVCPMHPQIRRPAPGECPLCGMVLKPGLPNLEEEAIPHRPCCGPGGLSSCTRSVRSRNAARTWGPRTNSVWQPRIFTASSQRSPRAYFLRCLAKAATPGYGMAHNFRSLAGFAQELRRIWFDCLRRRSQRSRRAGMALERATTGCRNAARPNLRANCRPDEAPQPNRHEASVGPYRGP